MAKRNKPGELSYVWENIPRDLWTLALAKCASSTPRKPIKWILLELLRDWVHNVPGVITVPPVQDLDAWEDVKPPAEF